MAEGGGGGGGGAGAGGSSTASQTASSSTATTSQNAPPVGLSADGAARAQNISPTLQNNGMKLDSSFQGDVTSHARSGPPQADAAGNQNLAEGAKENIVSTQKTGDMPQYQDSSKPQTDQAFSKAAAEAAKPAAEKGLTLDK